MTTRKITILGLPHSGKTTFIAAIWHVIDAKEVPTRLVLDRLHGDHSHLNRIVAQWRRGEEVTHTSLADATAVSIDLLVDGAASPATLHLPDPSGESFLRQTDKRSCDPDFVAWVNESDGLMFFLTADRPTDGVGLVDVAELLSEDGSEAETESGASTPVEWTHALIPQQVRVVELLQFLRRPPFARRLRRLAVIVSAWDLVVGDPPPTPDAWVAREMPLVSQFLATNADAFDVRTYGVSAQGRSLKSSADRSALLALEPSKRLICVGPNCNPHDITGPVEWLMGGA